MKKNSNLQNNKVIVILGPTSAGKSAVAIWVAKKFNGEILSADSRQIYRGMDVGTGKVEKSSVIGHRSSAQPLNQKFAPFWSECVAHYGIDIVSPKTDYSVMKFKKYSDKVISDILQRGKVPIICGGTGFWIKAIVDNVSYPEVKPDPVLRNKLRNKPTEELFEMLKKLDPMRAENIDAKNPFRLIRAIEICQTLGTVPTPMRNNETNANLRKYDFLQIGVCVPKEKLHEKIRKRLDDRWRAGMVEEVQTLHQQGLSWKKIQSFGLGYFWIPQYLHEKITLEELYERVYLAEKDYAKRQMTWFQRDKRIMWIDKYSDMEKVTKTFLKK